MKKFVYLCSLMLLSMNMMAQIDLDDGNWEIVLNDEFTNNSWYSWNNWLISHPNPNGIYYSYIPEWPSGVSRSSDEHHVYQRENCQFDNDGYLQFVSVYEGGIDMQPLQCGDYDIPPGKVCDTSHHTLFYTTAKIETDVKYLYGYFETRCSLPTHEGSHPAFWLYASGDNFYNEIDIFEYSNHQDPFMTYKRYNCAILCNNYSINSPSIHAQVIAELPEGSSDLRDFHTFALEWLPDRVTWYVDDVVVNEELNSENIPHHPMALKLNYAIDNYAVPSNGPNLNQPVWFDGDEMIVDYVKVYQLKADCDSDVLICNTQDIIDFNPSVKHSISIIPSSELTVPSNIDVTMRAETITIGTGFTLPSGAKMTFLTQTCPE